MLTSPGLTRCHRVTVPAGESASVDLIGSQDGGQALFALHFATAASMVALTCDLERHESSESVQASEYYWRGSHIAAVNTLFEHRDLDGPVVLETGHHARVVLHNSSGDDAVVYVQPKGMSYAEWMQLAPVYAQRYGGRVPKPRFAYIAARQVTANATDQRIPLLSGSPATELARLAIGATDDLALALSLEYGDQTVHAGRVARLHNRLYGQASGYQEPAIVAVPERRVDALVSNRSGQAVTFSALVEGYAV